MTTYYCHAASDALLRIAGPDTLKFLQGQTTCDTRQVDNEHALPGAYCNPQGRVVCDFLLCQLGEDSFGLRMRREILAKAAAVFGKYIVFSKAEIVDAAGGMRVFGIWGDDAEQDLAALFGGVPAERMGVTSIEHGALVRLDDAGRQFECYLDAAAGEPPFDNAMAQASENLWQALQLARGIARIEAATVEEFVPQAVNYDLTGHVSFSKGCYTGQEVVARLHYRGTPKRRTYLTALPANVPAPPGTALYTADAQQNAGHVVNSADDGERLLVLAAATAEGFTAGLHLGAPDGPALQALEQPYPVPDARGG